MTGTRSVRWHDIPKPDWVIVGAPLPDGTGVALLASRHLTYARLQELATDTVYLEQMTAGWMKTGTFLSLDVGMDDAENTQVPSATSRAEIERTLSRYGATAFGYFSLPTEARIVFEIANRPEAYAQGTGGRADREARLGLVPVVGDARHRAGGRMGQAVAAGHVAAVGAGPVPRRGHPDRRGLMPIRPENRDRYPADWPEISHRAKEAAGWRCACEGECGRGHDGRCPNVHGQPAYRTGSTVVLTTAHLDHTPENCDPDNLRPMCQGCHLHYDRDHHRETAAATRRARIEAAGQLCLFATETTT